MATSGDNELAIDTAERIRWLVQEAAAFAKRVGPPPSLIQALRLAAELGVIAAPLLTETWERHGLTTAGLHPGAVEKIARMLFGLQEGFRVATGTKGHWRTQLVVGRRLDDLALPAAAAIRPPLRGARMLSIVTAAELAPGLSAEETARLCEACWSLSPDRNVVVDWQPQGLDWGIGRILTAAGPVSADVVHNALARWVRDASGRTYDWTARTLDRYLSFSPLYEGRPGGTHVLRGEWCSLTNSDQHILAALDAVGAPAPRPALVDALINVGYSENAAKHLISVSPVVTPRRRGAYVRAGS